MKEIFKGNKGFSMPFFGTIVFLSAVVPLAIMGLAGIKFTFFTNWDSMITKIMWIGGAIALILIVMRKRN